MGSADTLGPMDRLSNLLEELGRRCKAVEEELETAPHEPQRLDDSALRFAVKGIAAGVVSTLVARCPADYYERDLEWRRCFLGAASIDHLCKSIVFENVRYATELGFGENDSGYNRYYLVVVQYTSKTNTQSVLRHAREVLNEGRSIPLKHWNLRLAEDCSAATGYERNAVTPIGLRQSMPVILDERVCRLEPPYLWLGAGEVDLKWRADISEFVRSVKPSIAQIS